MKHIWKMFEAKNGYMPHMLGPILDVEVDFCVAAAHSLRVAKGEQNVQVLTFVSNPNVSMRGTCEEDL